VKTGTKLICCQIASDMFRLRQVIYELQELDFCLTGGEIRNLVTYHGRGKSDSIDNPFPVLEQKTLRRRFNFSTSEKCF